MRFRTFLPTLPRLAAPLFLLGILLAGPGAAQEGLAVFSHDSLTIRTAEGAEHRFDVELALTPDQQMQGLMYRPGLDQDAGMLFVHRPARSAKMWMRNTASPLDLLFIAEDGRIVKMAERTVPYSLSIISSGRPVRGVLELNGGTAARLGLRPGDLVLHSAFDSDP